eukprot:s2552_g16.t1
MQLDGVQRLRPLGTSKLEAIGRRALERLEFGVRIADKSTTERRDRCARVVATKATGKVTLTARKSSQEKMHYIHGIKAVEPAESVRTEVKTEEPPAKVTKTEPKPETKDYESDASDNSMASISDDEEPPVLPSTASGAEKPPTKSEYKLALKTILKALDYDDDEVERQVKKKPGRDQAQAW